ncbi:hypothetical protein KDH_13460 [Dictyobacter sp. S3.2.2.5]|uniref:Uncharacterized protein n=1 Tax=Dictyobacter halimunensis TaxID=3026934 RepID=A0ABQ6FQ06_9CHLR|nr:hypothetical protein KDH_13460 [Dictyobacter sp. S3.2.2.5]
MNTENTVEQIELNDSDLEQVEGAFCGFGRRFYGGFPFGYEVPFGGCGYEGFGYGGFGGLYGGFGGLYGGYPFGLGGGCF